MKIQRRCRQEDLTAFRSIKGPELLFLIPEDLNDSSSSVFNMFILENEVPGPGQYNDVNPLSDRGYYPITKSSGFGKRYFDKEKRVV